MNLTREQEKRLKAGDYRPLFFPHDEHPAEPAEPQFKLVLDWEDSYRIADPLGNVTVVPSVPLRWIVVTSVKRDPKAKGWLVRFEAEDHRQDPRWLGPGGVYTTSRYRAIDELEVVPRKDLERMAKKAAEEWGPIRLERARAARQQWKRSRRPARVDFQRFRPAA